MKDQLALALGWIRKGDSDLADARRTLASEGPYDTACFHAQQAVEKYLKALLALRERPIPRTHDLEELARLVGQLAPSPPLSELDLGELTGHGVESRYDVEFWPSRETAAEALALAERARSLILPLMPAPPAA